MKCADWAKPWTPSRVGLTGGEGACSWGQGSRWGDGSALEMDGGGDGERGFTDELSATELHKLAILIIFIYFAKRGKRGVASCLSSLSILSVFVSSAAMPSCSPRLLPPAQSDCSCLLFSSVEL